MSLFHKILIADRGAIACRILRTLRRMNIRSVAVYTAADRHSLHVLEADEAELLDPSRALAYFSGDAMLEAARRTGAEAIHPGCGPLSESAEFAQKCSEAGVEFIGPAPGQLRIFGRRHAARLVAQENAIPLLPGGGLLRSAQDAADEAARIGFPVMLKSAGGHGASGMTLCRAPAEVLEAFPGIEDFGRTESGSGGVYLEKFITRARRFEVQIFGDGAGGVVSLGERDCSARRQHETVIAETPAPWITDAARGKLAAAAIRIGSSVRYQSAGTVEFIHDNDTEEVFFLDVHARLQAEHAITEEVTGIDLVEWMILLAGGALPRLDRMNIRRNGCAMQVRIASHDPARDFAASCGHLSHLEWAGGARVDRWVTSGSEISRESDATLACLTILGESRAAAVLQLRRALERTQVAGIQTNLSYLRQVALDPAFETGGLPTSFLEAFEFLRSAVDVIEPGAQATVQDYPGRIGYWHAGVPPSGPADPLAFRMANRLVGNPESAAALEITDLGPVLRFAGDAVIAVTGADFDARLDGVRLPLWQSIRVPAGSVLAMKAEPPVGRRGYLAVAGGLDVPEVLESRSTFMSFFGGYAGRALRAGDALSVGDNEGNAGVLRRLPPGVISHYRKEWDIGVLAGPQEAPDFLAVPWTVESGFDRSTMRISREGEDAQLQSPAQAVIPNAIGAISVRGGEAMIFGPDAPSLGNSPCPAVIAHAELWKTGQMKPGDQVRFHRVSLNQALRLDQQLEACVHDLAGRLPRLPTSVNAVGQDSLPSRVTRSVDGLPDIELRSEGDRCLLVEYSAGVSDLDLRLRIYVLEEHLRARALPGILNLAPGTRSLQIQYDPRILSRERLLDVIQQCEESIQDLDQLVVPSRVVHLPLAWSPEDSEAIREANHLDSVDDVDDIVFSANYMVLALGYGAPGAPLAAPVDPRHSLVTGETNRERMWAPENAVTLAGGYLQIRGEAGANADHVVGRTVQIWNQFRSTPEFHSDAPWLLRCLDQIRFFAVSGRDLRKIREAFLHGRYPLRIEPQNFRVKQYHALLRTASLAAMDAANPAPMPAPSSQKIHH